MIMHLLLPSTSMLSRLHLSLRMLSRYHSIRHSNLLAAQLTHRRLIEVKGPEVIPYLQGLVTNDMRYFDEAEPARQVNSLYSLLLDERGRVQYDLLLYKIRSPTDDATSILIECDHSLQSALLKRLTLYKLRRKIKLTDASSQYSLVSVFPLIESLEEAKTVQVGEFVAPEGRGSYVTRDPRMKLLGYRVIAPTPDKGEPQLLKSADMVPVDRYLRHLKMLGIGEGPADFPPGKCTPLESNGDYLNGVSFHKGCYVGQELTARTHHTGVVRKRLMPVVAVNPDHRLEECYHNADIYATMKSSEQDTCGTKERVSAKKDKKVGRFRSGAGKYGIALLKFDAVFDPAVDAIYVMSDAGSRIELAATKPGWWSELEVRGFQPDGVS